MRYALVILLVLHALAHLVGFAVPWQLVTSAEMPYRTTVLQGRIDLGETGIRLYGLGWLSLAAGCVVAAAGVALRSPWWVFFLVVLVAVSLIFCAVGWPEAGLGLRANAIILVVAFAAIRFSGDEIVIRDRGVEELWKSAPSGGTAVFNPGALPDSQAPARRFLEHSIALGTPLAASVRLKMHGEIKFGRWHPFRAEEVISRDGDFVWTATVSMYGIPIRGFDRIARGEGSMRWKLLDVVPMITAAGPQITRSAIGRVHGELAQWLPSALIGDNVAWQATVSERLCLRMEGRGESTEMEFDLDEQGGTRTMKFRRWGNPGGGEYGHFDFGVIVEEDGDFGGFTIPTRVRAGWFIGTERFESEGEFFRATIDEAEYK